MHLSTETVMEDQKQTPEEEQKQHSGGKTKRSFVSKSLNLNYTLYAVSTIMFHRPSKVKFNITFKINTSKGNVLDNIFI